VFFMLFLRPMGSDAGALWASIILVSAKILNFAVGKAGRSAADVGRAITFADNT